MQTLEIITTPQNAKATNVIDRIKTIQDAFIEYGIKGSAQIGMSDNLAGLLSLTGNFIKATVLTAALNEGWIPDWDESKEKKWVLYFNMRTKTFSLFFVYDLHGDSYAPSCLCFRNETIARYAFTQFLDIYKALFTTTII